MLSLLACLGTRALPGATGASPAWDHVEPGLRALHNPSDAHGGSMMGGSALSS